MSDPVQTRHDVRRALVALEERLEPLIDARLREFLHGLEWTEILRALDESRGRARGRYSRNDLAAQLRILTERLGELGYPFDDDPRHPRRVSSLGTQLRQLRNTERHSDVLEPHDAWRAGDHAAQLLDALGDVEGARRLAAIRDDVGRALYGGGQPMPARRELMPAEDIDGAVTPEVPIPAIPAVLDGAPLGDERLAYEPWHPVILGERSDIENLKRDACRQRVQGALKIIVETEGPVSTERLARLTAAAFERRISPALRRSLMRQIKQLPGDIDSDGFIWPVDIKLAEWTQFRPGPRSKPEDLCPREVANALRYWTDQLGAPASAPEVQAATLATFGRQRRTASVREVLNRAEALLE